MFLTLRNEKTLKKMRSKTLKNNIFFFLGRNLIIRSFEIPHSIWKLHKDFKSVFVFKFRQKTKKFTPKWQKPLFEKRVVIQCSQCKFPKEQLSTKLFLGCLFTHFSFLCFTFLKFDFQRFRLKHRFRPIIPRDHFLLLNSSLCSIGSHLHV